MSEAEGELAWKLDYLLAELPYGQRCVASALVADTGGRTYPEVAEYLGLHLGTVHEHLRRIRLGNPKVYGTLMKLRARQLARRHRRAVARAKAHSRRWFKFIRGR